MLSDDEALAVLLGLAAGRRTGLVGPTTGTASETAAAKIRRVLPQRLARRLDAVLGSLAFTTPPGQAPAPDAGVLLSIADAVRASPAGLDQVHRFYDGLRLPASAPCTPTGSSPTPGRWYVTGRGSRHRRGPDVPARLHRRHQDPARLCSEPPAAFDPAQARPVRTRQDPVPRHEAGPWNIQGTIEQIRAPAPRQRRDRVGEELPACQRPGPPDRTLVPRRACTPNGSTGCPHCSPLLDRPFAVERPGTNSARLILALAEAAYRDLPRPADPRPANTPPGKARLANPTVHAPSGKPERHQTVSAARLAAQGTHSGAGRVANPGAWMDRPIGGYEADT